MFNGLKAKILYALFYTNRKRRRDSKFYKKYE